MHTPNLPALVDSHCHLIQLDLPLDSVLAEAAEAGVTHFLCVCITRDDVPHLERLVEKYPNISISVGVHPCEDAEKAWVTEKELVALAQHPSCIAIGETGLDYYRLDGDEEAIHNQQTLFRHHIRAARLLKKPLIIHTREAREDTLRIMQEEKADDVGGVLHCFTETLEMALAAIELNFYISFSGIITFKNALALQEVAYKLPLDKILIETDSPYLAPVPFRGKQNHPALVRYVALKLSELRNISYEQIAEATTANFHHCFFSRER